MAAKGGRLSMQAVRVDQILIRLKGMIVFLD
jgi:hypothetical protein